MTKRKPESPDWLNKIDYSFTKDLSVKGWLKQFFIRESFSRQLEHDQEINRQNLWEKYLKAISQIADETEFNTQGGSLKCVIEIQSNMTVADIPHSEMKILSVDLVAPDQTIKEEFDNWLKTKRAKNGSKKSRSNHPHITPKKYGKWNNEKLLQLYDVRFWVNCLNMKVSGPVIAKWIYPDIDNMEGKQLYRSRCSMIEKTLKDLRPITYQAFLSS